MQVSVPVGILILLSVWALCAGVVYLSIKFAQWQELRNREPVVEIENIYDENGELETQITKIDGTPRMIIGRLPGEGF